MTMWLIILAVALVLIGTGIFYLSVCFSRFFFVKKLVGDSERKGRFFGFLCVAVLAVTLGIIFGGVNSAIIIVNLMLFFLIANIIAFALRKALKKERGLYIEGAVTLIAAAVYLGIGYYLAHNVWEKNYTLETSKDIGSLRVVLFADSHVGTTFDGEGLNKYVDEINTKEPDVVVIAGDYVDDGTTKEDMIAACKALGRLETKYGVYLSFGNHDKSYYGSENRGYSISDLEAELEKNGVTVLNDEYVYLDDRFYIVGRLDKSEENEKKNGSRKSAAELMQGLDKDKYTIMIDHQPNDYDAEAAAGADLVLSGHTHGGQMLPINRIGELIGANDFTYGHTHIEDTDFIVTSGISDWEIDFKTGCRSEYVVIDVN